LVLKCDHDKPNVPAWLLKTTGVNWVCQQCYKKGLFKATGNMGKPAAPPFMSAEMKKKQSLQQVADSISTSNKGGV